MCNVCFDCYDDQSMFVFLWFLLCFIEDEPNLGQCDNAPVEQPSRCVGMIGVAGLICTGKIQPTYMSFNSRIPKTADGATGITVNCFKFKNLKKINSFIQ